ncbi:MAG: hypothetical protein Kow0067_16480 [Coriobacteriia bacterium]
MGVLRRTAFALVTAALLVMAVVLSACTSKPLVPEGNVMHGDTPVSVVEAYFFGWQHQDWDYQETLVDPARVQIRPEPVTSVKNIAVFMTENDADHAVCSATFELGVPGEGATVTRGKHTWTFELDFDAGRGMFVITGITGDAAQQAD